MPSAQNLEQLECALIDRDGTIIELVDYLADPGQVRLIPGAQDALRRLQGLGLRMAIVTNQSGIGRGQLTEEDYGEVNRRMVHLVGHDLIQTTSVFHCPHNPVDSCECRKPEPGLALQAERRLGMNLQRAVVIGDNISDIRLGCRLGVPSILVRTGHGAEFEDAARSEGAIVVNDLMAAAMAIESSIRNNRTSATEAHTP